MACLVQVYFQEGARPMPHRPWEVVETGFDDFEDFCVACTSDEIISATILISGNTNTKGLRRVYRREPVIFRGSAVQRAQLPPWQFEE